MPYFDPTNAAHLARVHADVRTHPELADKAVQAEEDILRLFQRVTETGVEVMLLGYHADPAQATNEAMKAALIQEVADTVSHRLRTYSREYGVQSERRGDRSKSYFNGAAGGGSPWPSRALRRLLPYDTRRSVFYI